MAILKYYKVDSDGKIKRLRRECPSAECGAGIFVRRMVPAFAFCLMLYASIDGIPQGPSILRQVRSHLYFPARHQASRCLMNGSEVSESVLTRPYCRNVFAVPRITCHV